MGIDEDDDARSRSSRRSFLKVGAGVVAAGAVAAVATISQVPLASATGSPAQGSVSSASSQTSSLQVQSTSGLQKGDVSRQAFVYLNVAQQLLLEAVVETIIPTDSNGPGAKEAGVIYFIDGQAGFRIRLQR